MDQMYLKFEVTNPHLAVRLEINNSSFQYLIEPPYIKPTSPSANAISLMYPVLKGNAAFGGELSSKSIKHLLIEFNCLGIRGTQDVTLVIQAQNHHPLELTFRKECGVGK